MGEKKVVSELKRCMCEAQERVIKYSMMTEKNMRSYGVSSEVERQKSLARSFGERNAYRKALKLLGVGEDEIQNILEGVKIKARGECI